ncbi:hypothetical protein [Desulfopila inferna]|uniref:hypothetical protein n=1 Tax=Desulfopila inferna TaxID=468528 RepID=UPI001963BEB4|nr:hypothetical protein [Desulfopila inferna]MBM9603569.1 hypothetical protein [Desulfopila inferna]
MSKGARLVIMAHAGLQHFTHNDPPEEYSVPGIVVIMGVGKAKRESFQRMSLSVFIFLA